MGNQQETARKVLQKLFQPVAGFNIKVVCWFIQKQNIRTSHKNFGKGNSHLPSARKFFGQAVKITSLKTKSQKNTFGQSLTTVPSAFFQLCDVKGLTFQKCICIGRIFCQFVTNFINLTLKLVSKFKSFIGFFQKCASMVGKTALRKVSNAGIFLGNPVTGIRIYKTSHYLDECRFACPVCTGKCCLCAFLKIDCYVFKNVPVPESQGNF